jgi:cAMP-dependent protein kinase regulator
MSQNVNRSAQEHLLYIQEKVNPILEALVTAVLLEKPEDPSFFMLKWLCEQTKSLEGADQGRSSSDDIQLIRDQIKQLQERRGELLALRGVKAEERDTNNATEGHTDVSTKADDETESEHDDDDAVDVMPEPPKNYNRGPRQSVSAEAYGQWNVKTDFVAPVYEKTPEQKARIEKCIGPSFLFSSLEKEDMNTVLLAFKEHHVPKGKRIIQQGDDGESMYLIEEGKVDCLKIIDGVEKVVKTCIPGDVFGELALLYNCPRAASVQAVEATDTWELDRETFNRVVSDAAAKKRNTYKDFLKKVPLLLTIDDYDLMTIADALKVETIEDTGTQVIKQGDVGDKFFIVLEGECAAKKSYVLGQEPQVVRTHKVGDYFGELSLLKNEPRAATVLTSAAKTKLLWMDRKTFKRILGSVEEILLREAGRYATDGPAVTA